MCSSLHKVASRRLSYVPFHCPSQAIQNPNNKQPRISPHDNMATDTHQSSPSTHTTPPTAPISHTALPTPNHPPTLRPTLRPTLLPAALPHTIPTPAPLLHPTSPHLAHNTPPTPMPTPTPSPTLHAPHPAPSSASSKPPATPNVHTDSPASQTLGVRLTLLHVPTNPTAVDCLPQTSVCVRGGCLSSYVIVFLLLCTVWLPSENSG